MLSALLHVAAGFPAPLVLALVAVVLAVESGTVLGMAVPGTTVAVALGVWSSSGGPSFLPGVSDTAVCVAAAALGTVTGAHVGWWRGRSGVVLPVRASGRGPLARRVRHLTDRVCSRRRDGVAAALLLAAGHWASVLRPVAPRLAGAAGTRYRWAGPALTVSGTLWAAALVGLGARLGPVVAQYAGRVSLPVAAAVVLAVALRTVRGRTVRGRTAPAQARCSSTMSSNSPALAPCTNAEISAGV